MADYNLHDAKNAILEGANIIGTTLSVMLVKMLKIQISQI